MSSGEILTLEKRLDIITKTMSTKMKPVQSLLPQHVRVERFMRLVLTAVMNSPTQLAECSPDSLIRSMLRAAMLGLSIDDGRGLAYLVPFYNSKARQKEAQLVTGYRGLALLARQSGSVGAINMYPVRQGDEWDYDLYENWVRHKKSKLPAFDEKGNEVRPVIAAWARATMIGQFGGEIVRDAQLIVLEKWELDARRDGSAGYQAAVANGYTSPWMTNYAQMCAKTGVRDLCKLLPLSEDAAKAIMLDDDHDRGRVQRFDEYDDPAKGASMSAPTPQNQQQGGGSKLDQDADRFADEKAKAGAKGDAKGEPAKGNDPPAGFGAGGGGEKKKEAAAPSGTADPWIERARKCESTKELNRVSSELSHANLPGPEKERAIAVIKEKRAELVNKAIDSTEVEEEPPPVE